MPNLWDDQLVAGDFEQISISSTAKGFTSTKLQPTSGDYDGKSAHKVVVVPEDGSLRYRSDGTDPTTAVGMLLATEETLELKGYSTLSNTNFIALSGTVTLNVTYYYFQ
jgi:hypothetical protein